MYTDPSGYTAQGTSPYFNIMANNTPSGSRFYYRGEWVTNNDGNFSDGRGNSYGGPGLAYNSATGQYTHNGISVSNAYASYATTPLRSRGDGTTIDDPASVQSLFYYIAAGFGLRVLTLNGKNYVIASDPQMNGEATIEGNVYSNSDLGFVFGPQGQGDYDFGRTNNAFSLAGLAWGINQNIWVNNGRWLGKNLKYNSIAWWGNRFTGARSIAVQTAKISGVLGYGAFGVNLIYGGYGVYSGVTTGNYSSAVYSGMGTIYSGIATFGGIPGLVIAGPLVLIDATVGLDNFSQYQVNMNIERANRISQGDYSMMWYAPGRSIR